MNTLCRTRPSPVVMAYTIYCVFLRQLNQPKSNPLLGTFFLQTTNSCFSFLVNRAVWGCFVLGRLAQPSLRSADDRSYHKCDIVTNLTFPSLPLPSPTLPPRPAAVLQNAFILAGNPRVCSNNRLVPNDRSKLGPRRFALLLRRAHCHHFCSRGNNACERRYTKLTWHRWRFS